MPSTERGLRIMKKIRWLSDHIDPDNGLIGMLFSKSVIDFRQMQEMKKAGPPYKTNELLLNRIIYMSDDKLNAFEEALNETNQKHIIDYMNDTERHS